MSCTFFLSTYNTEGIGGATSAGLNSPYGVALDAAGKIYVTNQGNNTVTTYNPNLNQTTRRSPPD
jgi:DNA-binding beta-propeller fold protein YncE